MKLRGWSRTDLGIWLSFGMSLGVLNMLASPAALPRAAVLALLPTILRLCADEDAFLYFERSGERGPE